MSNGDCKEERMGVSLKCQYGLRALFELAKREKQGLVRLTDISAAQVIPNRFLENILNQLRQGGFVESRRGKDGGFLLARPAREIRVGDVIRFIEGPSHPVDCVGDNPTHKCELAGNCVFLKLWNDAGTALDNVYNSRTLADLIDEERNMIAASAGTYVI